MIQKQKINKKIKTAIKVRKLKKIKTKILIHKIYKTNKEILKNRKLIKNRKKLIKIKTDVKNKNEGGFLIALICYFYMLGLYNLIRFTLGFFWG